ncbi:MAG: exosortase A [Colwellia sp.]
MKILESRFLITLSLLIIAWAFVYKDALIGMEAIWSRSDTFAHGYFILPITLWLLWRDKNSLLASTVQPTWLALPFLVIALLVGLFAYAADINVLGQLSAVISLIFLLWLLMGNKLAWRYKFPFAYLLFSVPMGENLIPWLQSVTAWFTVFFLKLNGIPVYVDGLYIQIPTGLFEVAVACSGIRYLIASLAIGALYSYLTYSKLYKQIIFILFALTLPILANGIRAYGIVAIAYYSDMKYATGVDHLIYGWIFFGLIILLMFWVGGFFADVIDLEKHKKPKVINNTSANFSMSLSAVLGLTLPLLGLAVYLMQAIPSVDLVLDHKKETAQIALSTKSKVLDNSTWGINFTHAWHKKLAVNSAGIEIFRAIYANKQSTGEMISWENITHDHDAWTVIGTKELLLGGKPSLLVHLRSINGTPRSYLYHYKVGDYYTVDENKAKLMQAWNSLSRQSDFSEIVAVSLVGETDIELAEKHLSDVFIQIVLPSFTVKDSLARGHSFD